MIRNLLGGLTWKIGAFILFGLLVTVSGAALQDGISNRATIRTLEDERDIARGDIAAANERLGICQANYRSIELALDRQGADIRGLAAETKAAGARADAAARAGAAAQKAAQEASQRVLARPDPTPDTACSEAAKLLRGAM